MYRYVDVDAASEEKWGNLIKTWATGKSYFASTNIASLPVPRTLKDLTDQCAVVGINITVNPAIKALSIIQHSPEVLTIRLPPKKMIEDAEAALAGPNHQDYKLPHFYTVYCGPLNVPNGQQLKLQACRIGDYSMSMCQ